MATTKKPVDAGTTVTETSRRERILGWAELGVENAASAQKQWNDITFAYADLALKAWRDGLSWVQTYNEQSRKTLASLGEAREERAKAILARLS
jgi:hypothetical protein